MKHAPPSQYPVFCSVMVYKGRLIIDPSGSKGPAIQGVLDRYTLTAMWLGAGMLELAIYRGGSQLCTIKAQIVSENAIFIQDQTIEEILKCLDCIRLTQ